MHRTTLAERSTLALLALAILAPLAHAGVAITGLGSFSLSNTKPATGQVGYFGHAVAFVPAGQDSIAQDTLVITWAQTDPNNASRRLHLFHRITIPAANGTPTILATATIPSDLAVAGGTFGTASLVKDLAYDPTTRKLVGMMNVAGQRAFAFDLFSANTTITSLACSAATGDSQSPAEVFFLANDNRYTSFYTTSSTNWRKISIGRTQLDGATAWTKTDTARGSFTGWYPDPSVYPYTTDGFCCTGGAAFYGNSALLLRSFKNSANANAQECRLYLVGQALDAPAINTYMDLGAVPGVNGNYIGYGMAFDKIGGIVYIRSGYTNDAGSASWNKIFMAKLTLDPDTIAPAAISDLATQPAGLHSVTLTWTAPADATGPWDGPVGYDIRHSTAPIDEANWSAATQVTGEPPPSSAGTTDSMTIQGLAAGTAYYFAVKTSDVSGNASALSNVAHATTPQGTPPAPVTDLAASNIRSNSLTLTWTATGDDGLVGQASRYDLRYSTQPITPQNFDAATPVPSTPTPAPAGTGETVTLGSLAADTTYYFAIKVYDEWSNASNLSNVLQATTLPPDIDPPTTIADLRIEATRGGAVDLAWTAPADVGSAGMDRYDVRYATFAITEANWSTATPAANAPSPATPGQAERMTIDSLDAGTTWYFAVRSIDLASPANVSAVSNVVTAITGEAEDIDLAYLGAFKLTSPGGSGFAGGDLAYYPAGNGNAGSLFVSRGYVDAGMPEIRELAIPALTISSDANALNAATVLSSLDVSGKPQGLLWRSTNDKLYYSWPDGYGLSCRSINRDGSAESPTESGSWLYGGSALFQVPDDWAPAQGRSIVTLGNIYGIHLLAIDPSNLGTVTRLVEYGNGSTLMPDHDGADSFDAGQWVTAGGRSVILIAGYKKAMDVATLWFYDPADIAAAAHTYDPHAYRTMMLPGRLFTGVTGCKTLYGLAYDQARQVLYGLEAGSSPTAPAVIHAWRARATGIIDTPPTTIGDLAVASTQMNSITLAWKAPMDDRGQADKVDRYDIRYSTAPITDANWDAASPTSNNVVPLVPKANQSFTVSGLTPNTTYYLAVRSLDAAGHLSALSNVVSSRTLAGDGIVPAAVTDLSAPDVKSNRVQLRWTATGDDGLAGRAERYDIRYSTTPLTEATFAAAQAAQQDIRPAPAGQLDTFVINGLTAGTTYYIALKVLDEQGNASALSNVVQVTTLPSDTTPPAAVTNLAATSSDAFSANLSWTAVGDDAFAGTADRYEVRYSTSPIDESNWASATTALSAPAPQPSGTTEHFTVKGLQPATSYFFALKVTDAAANTSALSNLATCTTATMPPLPEICRVTIVEKAGVTTADYPLTLSLVFRKGDVADTVTVRTAGQVLPTQTDVKVRYDDGSVKHALVSVLLPTLSANQQAVLEILSGGPNANDLAITREDLLARDFDAAMTIDYNGLVETVSARQLLRLADSPATWLRGNICTEFLLADLDRNIANQLNVQYRVRVYHGHAGIRVDTVVENCWSSYRGNLTYDFALRLGRTSPVTVFEKTAFTHNYNARWHRVFWQDAAPAEIQVRYDLPYMISTGLLPRYDTSLVVPESTLSAAYSGWQKTNHDIMGNGIILPGFPTTGGRQEIGLYPTWAARYLLSWDNRQKEITLSCGDLSGSIPIHVRESDPLRSFHKHIISIDDRPTIWLSDLGGNQGLPADKLPPPVGLTDTIWQVDLAHQASFAHVPYLVTGDYYYLEEMYFWAAYNLANGNYGYRQGSKGIIVEQTRGEAWGIRNVADAAVLAPDGHIEKAYFTQKVNNNLAFWTDKYVVKGDYPTIRYWKASMLTDSVFTPQVKGFTSAWMDDFVLIVLGHLQDIGFDSGALVNWLSVSVINRFHHPDFNGYRGAPYHMPVLRDDGSGNAVPFETWAQLNAGFVDQPGPTAFTNNAPNSYNYIARAALTRAAHLVDGRAAWDWLDSRIDNKAALNQDPTWALLPAPVTVGDANGDNQIDVVDLLTLAGTWGKRAGDPDFNPACDFNADAAIDVVDLLTLAENWPH